MADPAYPRRYTWNGVPGERELVEAKFAELMATGNFTAIVPVETPAGAPKRSRQITAFEADEARITLIPALAGG